MILVLYFKLDLESVTFRPLLIREVIDMKQIYIEMKACFLTKRMSGSLLDLVEGFRRYALLSFAYP